MEPSPADPTTIDPVSQPREYQELLLGLVGEDDPAALQEEAASLLEAVLADAGELLRARPAESEWSVVELLGHILDAETVATARYRWILAHDRPPLVGYDQDLWVQRLHHQDADPAELLGQFRALRSANLALWARSTPEERSRVGIHQERGEESYDLTFRLIAGHDRFHLNQMRRTLQQVRSG